MYNTKMLYFACVVTTGAVLVESLKVAQMVVKKCLR